jgi:hypothetical protein
MAKVTTRDAALSRLFGNVQEGAAPKRQVQKVASKQELVEPDSSQTNTPEAPKRRRKQSKSPSVNPEEGRGEGALDPDADKPEPAPSSYIGLGRYARVDGIVERITPYVRPDQAEALRLAAARKNDPRGTDISQIIQALLDEAGYAT